MKRTYYRLYAFPDEWPVERYYEINRHENNDYKVVLYTDITARLKVKIFKNNQIITKYFQPITFNEEGLNQIFLIINDDDITIYIDDYNFQTKLPQLIELNSSDELLILNPPIKSIRKYNPIYRDKKNKLVKSPRINRLEQHFLETLISLEEKILIPNGPNLKEASAYLRALLLDGLYQKVNSEYKLDIKFSTLDVEKFIRANKQVDFDTQIVNPFMLTRSGKNTIINDLDEFLKISCVRFKNTDLTVKNVIRAWSNSKGGVHFGKPKGKEKDLEQLIIDLDYQMTYDGKDTTLMSIMDISKVTLEALEPLANKILDFFPATKT